MAIILFPCGGQFFSLQIKIYINIMKSLTKQKFYKCDPRTMIFKEKIKFQSISLKFTKSGHIVEKYLNGKGARNISKSNISTKKYKKTQLKKESSLK